MYAADYETAIELSRANHQVTVRWVDEFGREQMMKTRCSTCRPCTETVFPCSECGHLHFVNGDYIDCPLSSEGCTCPLTAKVADAVTRTVAFAKTDLVG